MTRQELAVELCKFDPSMAPAVCDLGHMMAHGSALPEDMLAYAIGDLETLQTAYPAYAHIYATLIQSLSEYTGAPEPRESRESRNPRAPIVEDEDHEQESDESKDVFSIPEENLPGIQNKMSKLAKTAAKLGVAPMTLEVIGHEDKEYVQPEGRSYFVKHVIVRISGEPPVLNGWRLVARILHGEEGNIVKAVPGQTVPVEYRTTKPECAHCKKVRARKDTFVVTDGSQWMQVGTSCLADFLGHADPRGYVNLTESYADLGAELDMLSERMGGGERGINAEDYLAVVSAVRRAYGWVSRTKAMRDEEAGLRPVMPTSDVAWNYLENPQARNSMKDVHVEDSDKQAAQTALAWARDLRQQENLSDYLWNLAIAASGPAVYWKTKGILASTLVAYENATRAPDEATPTAKGWVGREGLPVVSKGKIKEIKSVNTFRGASFLHTFEDANGNLIKWFASSEEAFGVAGDDIAVTGVVQKHGEYQGARETMLIGVRKLDDTEYSAALEAQTKAEEARAGRAAAALVFATGDKLFRRVRVTDKKYIESDYGTTALHMLVDEETGQSYKWFASSEDLEIGRTFNMECTVKGNEEYKGRKYTLVTRCKLFTDEEFAAGGKPEKYKSKLKPKDRKRMEAELVAADNRLWDIKQKILGVPVDSPEKQTLQTEYDQLLALREATWATLSAENEAEEAWRVSKHERIYGK